MENKENDYLKEIIDSDILEPTDAFNIILQTVQSSYNEDFFTDLDRYLIAKSLNSFKHYVEKGEDIIIKVK